MNTNVGDMPIEIFGDYTSDSLDEEWSWECIVPVFNDLGDMRFGDGKVFFIHNDSRRFQIGGGDLAYYHYVNCSEIGSGYGPTNAGNGVDCLGEANRQIVRKRQRTLMNDNVGEMPIEIFGDYVSDSLGVEFPWEMLTPMFNGENDIKNQRGSGWWYNYDYGHGDIYGTEGAWGDGQGEIGCGAGNFCVFFCDGIAQGNGH